MNVIKARLEHLDDLVILFDEYRIFYQQSSNTKEAKTFLSERIKNKDSTIFIAYIENKAVGFTQLYPLFSSVSMKEIYLLNDLFVHRDHRGKGIGESIIKHAKSFCKNNNCKGLAIQTAMNNPAQNLYQRLGFEKDPDLHFFWNA